MTFDTPRGVRPSRQVQPPRRVRPSRRIQPPRGVRPSRRRRRARVGAAFLAIVALAAAGALAVHVVARPGAEPAVAATGLSPELQRRFDEAAAAAAAEGVELTISSGWRSADEQRALLADAIATYGSEAAAHRYVLPPDKSAHVLGTAIDVGPPSGAAWLTEHGAAFGLCRVYENEVWHFEPLVDPGGTCPPLLPDSSGGWS